jgi:hypothetical protein
MSTAGRPAGRPASRIEESTVARSKAKTTRSKETGARAASTAPPPGAAGAEDRSFGKILGTKSVGRIVPDAVARLETGRRQYVREGVAGADAELDLLRAERKRLEGEEDPDAGSRRLSRVSSLISAVEVDLVARKATLEAIDRADPPQPGGWNVFGRVLQRNGLPAKATVVFVVERGQPLQELGVLPVGNDGFVRKAYPAEVIAPLVKKGVAVSASVRISSRVLATEENRFPITANGLHQFDFVVDM